MGAVLDKEEAKNRRDNMAVELYFNKDETGDVTFIVESKRIHAHRCVLAAISPKYKAQFYGSQPDKGDIIVEDISADAFEAFLQYFYLGDVNMTAENIEGILNLAKQALIDDVESDCVSFLKEQAINKKNICQCYQLAILHDIEELKPIYQRLISVNVKEVINSDDFLDYCDRNMLMEILKMDSLNCKETDLFNACISWAKANCSLKNIDAGKIENVRAEIGNVLNEIRFRSMTIEEFVQLHSSHDGFFTPNEMMEIMYIIGNLKDFKPSNFNLALRKRLSISSFEQPTPSSGFGDAKPPGFGFGSTNGTGVGLGFDQTTSTSSTGSGFGTFGTALYRFQPKNMLKNVGEQFKFKRYIKTSQR